MVEKLKITLGPQGVPSAQSQAGRLSVTIQVVSTPEASDDLIARVLGVQPCCASLHTGCQAGPQRL